MKLTQGMRVVGIGVYDQANIDGLHGVIVDNSVGSCLIRFDKPMGGHGAGGREWWVRNGNFRLETKGIR